MPYPRAIKVSMRTKGCSWCASICMKDDRYVLYRFEKNGLLFCSEACRKTYDEMGVAAAPRDQGVTQA